MSSSSNVLPLLPLLPPPSPAAPLARSQTTCAEYTTRDEVPLSRSMSSPPEFTPTPTCPPPVTRPPPNCCSQFSAAPYPEPPALRRTDTSADYAPLSSKITDTEYDRWLIEDNFARLSAMEEKLRKQMSDLGMIRESLYQLSRRLNGVPVPPPPSSPVTRQVASPNAAPAPAPASPPALDMAREFGM